MKYQIPCMEVWVSGLNQHTANVPNRKVPKVRILLLPQEYKLEDCRNGNGPDLKSEVTEMLWEFESLIFRKMYI